MEEWIEEVILVFNCVIDMLCGVIDFEVIVFGGELLYVLGEWFL